MAFQSSPKAFLLHLLLYTLALGLIAFGLTFLLPLKFFSPALPFLFPFFFAASFLVFTIVNKASNLNFSKFVNRYMLVTFGKLMFFIIVLLLYVFANKSDAVQFILSFFILYVFFSVFELVTFLKK